MYRQSLFLLKLQASVFAGSEFSEIFSIPSPPAPDVDECVCSCMHTHVCNVCIQCTHVCLHACTNTHARTCVHTHAHTQTRIDAHMHTRTHSEVGSFYAGHGHLNGIKPNSQVHHCFVLLMPKATCTQTFF